MDLVWTALLCMAAVSSASVCNDPDKSAEELTMATEDLLRKLKKYVAIQTRENNPQPMECAEVGNSRSGVYRVWPRSRLFRTSLHVFCDMEDDGGGWTVLQRRGDFDSAKDYFYRDWNAYKEGFGNLRRDFWIGNDNIFALTNQRACSVKFTLVDWEGNATYAAYDDFWMDDEKHNYTMHVGGYRGTAGDSFSFTNGMPFTTKDKDNDKHDGNCAVSFKGAWWYTSCHSSNLNGQYLKGHHESYADGVEWSSFRGQKYSLKDVVIKIRPKHQVDESTKNVDYTSKVNDSNKTYDAKSVENNKITDNLSVTPH